jgi:DNA replication protein DnaC
MNKTTIADTGIREMLEQLGLTGMRDALDEQTAIANKDSLEYKEYLDGLLRRECEARLNRRVRRCLKKSRLPLEKTLENYDLNRLPLQVRQQIQALRSGSFLRHKENLLVFGKPGTGKTHMVCGLARELIKQGNRILFTTCAKLVQELLIAKKALLLPKILARLGRYDAIIIDDIGYVQQDRHEMEILFTLLSDRYERGSLMITSNLPFSKWEAIFKDSMMTAAAIDRLVHHSVILEMNVPSYRMEKARLLKSIGKGGQKARN